MESSSEHSRKPSEPRAEQEKAGGFRCGSGHFESCRQAGSSERIPNHQSVRGQSVVPVSVAPGDCLRKPAWEAESNAGREHTGELHAARCIYGEGSTHTKLGLVGVKNEAPGNCRI